MSDILTDYREWRAKQPTRISTHSDRCHLWHRDCLIHRLAAALAAEQAKRTPQPHATPCEGRVQDGCTPEPVAWMAFATDGSEAAAPTLHREEADEIAARHGWAVAPLYRSPTLTDDEREAIAYYVGTGGPDTVDATLRGLLERTK
jgi:hypothetical protein